MAESSVEYSVWMMKFDNKNNFINKFQFPSLIFSLSIAVSLPHIYLFSTLTLLWFDIQQMNEILDAMFEKKVQPEDVIIRQGDDGDNFYVIES